MDLKTTRSELFEAAQKHPLYQNIVKTGGKIVFGRGCPTPEVLIIGEAPGNTENKDGRPFVGPSGKILDNWIDKFIAPKKVAVINAVPIIPLDEAGKIRKPTPDEIAYFRPYTENVIKAFKPKYIIAVGKTAAEFLEANFKLGQWDDYKGMKLGYIYHPAYYLRNGSEGNDDCKKLMEGIAAKKVLKQLFSLNKQQADNQGHTEMISGILAGLHIYAKQSNVYFKDINQNDECVLGDKKVKVYTRDALSDEDMLIYESYFSKHPEIDIYICCKIKAGKYTYLGYVTKDVVAETRKVQMIGEDSDKESQDIRRIFEEQYKPMSDIFKIYEEEEGEEVIVEQKWIPLHMHSEFSIGDGFGTIPYITEELRKKGFKGAALTDHGTLSGCWEFQKHMLLRGMKPILGCEIYTKLEGVERRFHTIVLVKNEQGWKNLLKLQAMANREHFYYKPVVPFDELLKNKEGLMITSGCSSSPLPVMVSKKQFDIAEDLLKKIIEAFGDDFYFEMQPHTITDNQEVMQKLWEFAQKYNVKTIITTDAHYPNAEDKKFHDAVKSISMKKSYPDGQYGDDCFFVANDEELLERIKSKEETHWMLPHLDGWKENTLEILSKTNFEIKPPEVDSTLPVVEITKIMKEEIAQNREKYLEVFCNADRKTL